MYNVSNDYLIAFKKPVHRWKLRGTVGNIAFTEANILTGSFHLSNAASGNDDITLGMTNIGELSATFVNLSLSSWKNKEIYVEIGLTKSGGVVEYVPAGRFTVTSAERSADGVSVVAYDNMRLFDIPFFMQLGASNAYDLLAYACLQCGVPFGMESLAGFCNENLVYPADYAGTIKTYRDLIYWVAQTQCAFATIDRNGALVLRRFVSAPVDTINAAERYNTSRFSDYETHYTAISLSMDDGTTQYYGLPVDDGSTIELGQNPLLQRIQSVLEPIIANMLAEIAQIEYTPFSATMLGGIHYDLGDVLTEAGGIGAGATVVITGYDYNFNVGYEMVGVGKNPLLANAQSKADKDIQSLLVNTNKNEFRDYVQKNASQIVIGDQENERILQAWLASNNNTNALIHVEINLESEANPIVENISVQQTEDEQSESYVAGEDVFALVSDKETRGTVTYFVDNEEIPFKPVEQWTDGKHILHLMYVLPLQQGMLTQFRIFLKADGGTLKIPSGGLWFYGSGRGLVGDDYWGGILEFEEQAAEWAVITITVNGAGEIYNVETQVPVGITVSDNAADFNLAQLTFTGATDSVTILLHTYSFRRITEENDIRVTEDGIVRYTEGD